MDIQTKALDPEDLDEITRIHLAAFPRSAMTQLGREAVRRYYDWQLSGPHKAVNLGAWLDGRLVGFCFGGIFNGALWGFLRKNRNFLIWRVLTHPWLLGNELVRSRISIAGRIFQKRSRGAVAPSAASAPQARLFGILAIAVDPAVQGKGVGQRLMAAEELAAITNRFKGMNLSVATDNRQAIGFYERLGWRRIVDQSGIWNGRMEKQLDLNG